MSRLKKIEDFERYTITEDGIVYGIYGKKMKPNLIDGRLVIGLRDKTGKQCYKILSRLVAKAFCNIPKHLKSISTESLEVHHIDRNPLNNNYKNLMWVTSEEHKAIHKDKSNAKPIVQIEGGTIIHIYNSLKEAATQTGIPIQNISDVVSGTIRGGKRRLTAGGYKWTNKLEGKYILSLQ